MKRPLIHTKKSASSRYPGMSAAWKNKNGCLTNHVRDACHSSYFNQLAEEKLYLGAM
jgi:hypothetical protein